MIEKIIIKFINEYNLQHNFMFIVNVLLIQRNAKVRNIFVKLNS